MSDHAALTATLAGRYAIEREIGRGGMATVYLARDVKHERHVAVKVLHPDLAAALGAERFLAEIRTTANLQHPHILPLHDSGEADGFLFYVMPFVEGETLRARLERERQLPIDDAVRITREALAALDYAHRRGVVHRDVKPENILLHEGQALVADFGIALAVQSAGGQRMTQTGLSLGTPSYMSPEQAMGERTIDGRADVYAAGAVLYEMLTGEPPFSGATVQAIVAKVLTERPTTPSTVRDTVPPHVEGAALKALAKLPADRFATAKEFAEALDPNRHPRGSGDPGAFPETPDARVRGHDRSAAPRATRSILRGLPWLVAAAATGIAVWSSSRTPRTPPAPVERYELAALGVQPVDGAVNNLVYAGPTLALSADGTRLAYVRRDGGGARQVWVRDAGDLTPRPVEGSEGATSVTISPDGGSVAFIAGTSLRAVALSGGGAVDLVREDATMPWWGPDGKIYFVTKLNDGQSWLRRVPETGGRPDSLVSVSALLYDPSLLPGGRALLVSSRTPGAGGDKVSAVSLADGALHELVDGLRPRYVEPGYIVYVSATRRLMAVPFDPGRLRVTGRPVPLVEGASADADLVFQFAASAAGTLVYMTGVPRDRELVWVARTGAARVVDSTYRANIGFPALSPDGTRAAVNSNGVIWIKPLDGGAATRLTVGGRSNNYPAWTRDGRSLSYFATDSLGYHLWLQAVGGGAPRTPLVPRMRSIVESVWSRDGTWLVFRTAGGGTGAGDIYAIRPAVDSAPIPLLASPHAELEPALSPDGRWLAYVSTETGRHEVYVVPFPHAASARWPISARGGVEPMWSPRGDELFYRDGAGNMVAVKVTTNPAFTVGASSVLFSAVGYESYTGHRQYDVAADGQRFLMLRPAQGRGEPRVVLVRHWLGAVRGKEGAK